MIWHCGDLVRDKLAGIGNTNKALPVGDSLFTFLQDPIHMPLDLLLAPKGMPR